MADEIQFSDEENQILTGQKMYQWKHGNQKKQIAAQVKCDARCACMSGKKMSQK